MPGEGAGATGQHRCGAKTRTGRPCALPAMRGNRRCRLHGARGGGESGNRNALKHGLFTRESIAERRDLRALEKMLREALEGWG